MTNNFNGFQSPNFSPIPNEYLDYTISPECDLSKVQMQIMNLFFRETFGWQDKYKAIILSLSDVMAILGLSKKKTVVDALNGLTESNQFLESVEVGELPKEVRQNIEVSLRKTLQPRQKLYRLNLADRRNKSWDFAERTHINIAERKTQSSDQTVTTLEGSDQMVTTSSTQTVTTSSDQTVTTLEAEPVETVDVKPSLNKGLNKELNKTSSSRGSNRDSIDAELKAEYPHVPFEVEKEKLLKDETAVIQTDSQYYAMLEYRLMTWKPKQQKASKPRKPIRTEKLPQWYKETNQTDHRPKQSKQHSKETLDELLKQLGD